ncbi:MAG: hypothetical protein R3E76_04740 [Planctomycetota bacterium]
MPSADVARLHSGLAEESPSQVDKSNDPVDNHGPLEPGPAAESASTDSNSIRPPLPVVDPSDAPKPQAEAVRYQEKMQLGAARASLLLETPLEWLQQYLRSVASVDSLGVQPGALTPEAVDVIAESGNVKHMDFSAVHLMSNEASSALSRLSEVESIGISTNRPYSSNSGPVEEELNPFIQPLLSMPDLKTLSIGGAINDELLRMISELGRLETLRLENNNDLRRYDKITTAGIMYLSRLSGLKELVMINFTVGRHRIDLDRLTDLLYGFPGLERLSLAGWTMADKHLAPCSFVLCRLSYLNLNNTDITDGFYRNIDATWMLEELSAPGIGDKGLQAVASAPNLKRLSAGERVTDVGVEFLAENAHGLEALCIERAAITDDSLIALQQCQSLRELSVRFTANITLAGLKQLCEARQLEILDTSGNKFVTRTVVEELLSVSPSLKTLIHYPYSVLTNGDRQKLMSDFPEVTIAPFPLTSQWYR